MSNKAYKKGCRLEYKIIKEYREQGYITSRARGSHGIWDVCAIDKDKKRIIFIQCKAVKKMGKRARANLEKKHEWLNDDFSCYFEVR